VLVPGLRIEITVAGFDFDKPRHRQCRGFFLCAIKPVVPGAVGWFAPSERGRTRSPDRKVGASADSVGGLFSFSVRRNRTPGIGLKDSDGPTVVIHCRRANQRRCRPSTTQPISSGTRPFPTAAPSAVRWILASCLRWPRLSSTQPRRAAMCPEPACPSGDGRTAGAKELGACEIALRLHSDNEPMGVDRRIPE